VIEGGIEMSNVRTDLDVLLVDQGMPRDEVRSVLAARDPRIVRRHLELHRERLMERALEERGVRWIAWRPPSSRDYAGADDRQPDRHT
jgi:hypothetical protein